MSNIPHSSNRRSSLGNRQTASSSDREAGGLRWLGWLLQFGIACGAVVVIERALHQPSAHSDWKDALTSIPLRDDAFISGYLEDSPLVGLEEMPLRVFGIEGLPSNGADSARGNVADDGQSPADWLIVSLAYSQANDEHLRLIGQCPRIRSLALDGTRITDVGLAHLPGMVHLETLSLGATEISDAGAQALGKVRSLRYLDLRRTRLTNASLASLAALRKLESLNLSGTRVEGRGLAQLSGLPRLQVLLLNDTMLDDDDVESLLGFTELREIQLQGTCISEAGVARLESLPNLKMCNVDWGTLARDDLEALRWRGEIQKDFRVLELLGASVMPHV